MSLIKSKKPNDDVRQVVKESGFYAYQVASKIGCHENTYHRMLRNELSVGEKQMIYVALDELKAEREQELAN